MSPHKGLVPKGIPAHGSAVSSTEGTSLRVQQFAYAKRYPLGQVGEPAQRNCTRRNELLHRYAYPHVRAVLTRSMSA